MVYFITFNFFEWGTGLIDFARFFPIFAKYKFKLLQITCESRTFFLSMSSLWKIFFSLIFELIAADISLYKLQNLTCAV